MSDKFQGFRSFKWLVTTSNSRVAASLLVPETTGSCSLMEQLDYIKSNTREESVFLKTGNSWLSWQQFGFPEFGYSFRVSCIFTSPVIRRTKWEGNWAEINFRILVGNMWKLVSNLCSTYTPLSLWQNWILHLSVFQYLSKGGKLEFSMRLTGQDPSRQRLASLAGSNHPSLCC